MSSKNNPDARGDETKPRTYGGKKVKPVLLIDGPTRYIAAAYEDGKLVVDAVTKKYLPYASTDKTA